MSTRPAPSDAAHEDRLTKVLHVGQWMWSDRSGQFTWDAKASGGAPAPRMPPPIPTAPRMEHREAPPPSMLCLLDRNPATLAHAQAALVQLRALKGRAANQYDNAQDEERSMASGLPAPKLFGRRLFAEQDTTSLDAVRARVWYAMAEVAATMGVRMYDQRKGTGGGHDNMGFATSLTEYYASSEEHVYLFHADSYGDRDSRRPSDTEDYIQVTAVYYMVDPANEAEALRRAGQGSTLYNLQNTARCSDDTDVAYCPLQNGVITIFDGSNFHGVGPNYGVERGAVIFKCFLYRPYTPKRRQSREVWWQAVQEALFKIAADPANEFLAMRPPTMKLCDALRRPS